MNNIVAVVFAYNEAKHLPRTLQILNKQKNEGRINKIVVVNDGSTDGTKRIALQNGAIVVSHPQNLGKRASFITGANKARTLGADIMLNFDADLVHLPTKTLTEMVNGIRNGKDMMIAQQMEKNFIGEKTKDNKIKERNFRKTLMQRSNAQRAIKMSALAPLFNGNKKWLRFLSAPVKGRIAALEVLIQTNPEMVKKINAQKNKWELEAALDILIRKQKFTEGKVYTEAAFKKEKKRHKIGVLEDAQTIAANKMKRTQEARNRLARMKRNKRMRERIKQQKVVQTKIKQQNLRRK
ncbi:MAG: glycosyltransferase family 2 protein [Candidatus Diapherotrites archaeon]|uniref:Glycosyltransferase family 2 protein n=1 Tax=Candidatus Iainarchaeum sp. TaxID=3101447 RepID=A0A7K4BYN5_9ARCH|nr:glycosyltransferase family 2 protein [Candidatus Diapherotrites archaeon]